ncbi:MAG TPA: hypothetical protein ENH62_10355 [Marinobacter sp.]|uniref:Uncharacterized protein n=1 Tax=marine sediment metagenome TaxID=412755 RepID=A0A0F9R170_9ZZZZ|nr:hypothetical protein [Marinobacter sp.]
MAENEPKRGPGRPPKVKTAEETVDLSKLKADQPVTIQVVQKKEKKEPYRLTPEAIGIRDDPVRTVTFYNLQDPKMDFAFNYGPLLNGGKRYHLRPGHSYSLPQCVINHLRSIRMPVRKTVPKPDGEKGETIVAVVSHIPLYLLSEQPDQSQQEALAKAQKPVAVAS